MGLKQKTINRMAKVLEKSGKMTQASNAMADVLAQNPTRKEMYRKRVEDVIRATAKKYYAEEKREGRAPSAEDIASGIPSDALAVARSVGLTQDDIKNILQDVINSCNI